jgi:hypothetical protein
MRIKAHVIKAQRRSLRSNLHSSYSSPPRSSWAAAINRVVSSKICDEGSICTRITDESIPPDEQTIWLVCAVYIARIASAASSTSSESTRMTLKWLVRYRVYASLIPMRNGQSAWSYSPATSAAEDRRKLSPRRSVKYSYMPPAAEYAEIHLPILVDSNRFALRSRRTRKLRPGLPQRERHRRLSGELLALFGSPGPAARLHCSLGVPESADAPILRPQTRHNCPDRGLRIRAGEPE